MKASPLDTGPLKHSHTEQQQSTGERSIELYLHQFLHLWAKSFFQLGRKDNKWGQLRNDGLDKWNKPREKLSCKNSEKSASTEGICMWEEICCKKGNNKVHWHTWRRRAINLQNQLVKCNTFGTVNDLCLFVYRRLEEESWAEKGDRGRSGRDLAMWTECKTAQVCRDARSWG